MSKQHHDEEQERERLEKEGNEERLRIDLAVNPKP
jgi:hypothetical protein